MVRRVKVSVPDSFIASINELVVQARKEDEEVKKQADQRKKEAEERRIREEKRIKKGLKYAEYIFSWSEAFRESETGQLLMKIGHMPVDGVYIFDGHVPQKSWRGIGIGKKGIWWMRNGCGATEHYVQTPRDLAKQIDPEILELAHEWIEEGKVWTCIRERMDTWRAKSAECQRLAERYLSHILTQTPKDSQK
ncbi:MAG: hypothetical protein HY454_01715 [Parcubacteria group bacterium]|nr:hypothetical protein [Parcubacteria group bacterium]